MKLLAILSASLVGLIAGAALTIAPPGQSYGRVPVLDIGQTLRFVTSLPAGTTRGTILTYSISGPDAVDFSSDRDVVDPFDGNGGCATSSRGVECTSHVVFIPRSVGPKRATLVVTDNHGHRASAMLDGTGVLALCNPHVVWCNYAHHYSGVVSWGDGTAGVHVDVEKGVATCNATGESEFASGPGLVAVEFDQSGEAPSPFYRITVACPTRYPPEPPRPAELGHGELGSYKQPLGMALEDVHKAPPRLKGSDGEVSWNLCSNARYVPAVRQGPRATAGPHDPCPDPGGRTP